LSYYFLLYFYFLLFLKIAYGQDTGAAFYYSRGTYNLTLENNASFIYQTPWELNFSFPSPAGSEGAFGWGIGLTDQYVALGADGYGKLFTLL
jgi:hypothetical protein